MEEKLILTTPDLIRRIHETWAFIDRPGPICVYGVPRGGWNIAALLDSLRLAILVDSVQAADIIVDDVVDSEATKNRFRVSHPDKPFWAPFDKSRGDVFPWVVFPWEGSAGSDAEDIVRRMLQFIGEDPTREGLVDTPARVVRSWAELFSGHKADPDEVLSRTFKNDSDEMIICRDIEFYSTCEHHLIPFFGTVSIGYLPKGQVVGLSKLARLVEVYGRRLQIQEQFTGQVAKALAKVSGVRGVGVVVRAKHLCMCGRGVAKQGSSMVTSAMLGEFRDDPSVRAEFLRLIQ